MPLIKHGIRILLLGILLCIIPDRPASAETLEEQLNNLIGPKQQYNTMLSPVYLRTNETEEYISPQSGELSLTQTDYVLPGRNGLDVELKRIYKSGVSNVQEMKVEYVDGAWVDYVYSDALTSSFYEDRYNLGIGMRFSFPQMEVRTNSDGTSHKFLHTESGDVYRLKYQLVDGQYAYLPEGQTIKDAVVKETAEYSNGQTDGTSKYVLTGKDGKKTYFAADGRLLGIRDRYGNTISFEYADLSYTVNGQTVKKRLMSKITDTVGRTTTIEYKEDHAFTVGPIANTPLSAEESWKASQNPNNTDSGDLQGKFQVIVRLPGDKSIVYDKSAVLVNSSKQVMRTRLQRVFDADGKPKYHFWYEQPDLGFTYMNGTQYSAYNRYENLIQIDYAKTNRMKRYAYDNFTKTLHQGSMQYRKVFEKKDLVKTGYDATKSGFPDKFATEAKNKTNYAYTNEADGFGYPGYNAGNDAYLRDTYKYYTVTTDVSGNETKYTYDGLHQLLITELKGADHKETLLTERDEMKLVKKKETWSYPIVNGQAAGEPVKRIENYRYDEYGNMTNYTGPEAVRDANGYPVDTEHTVVYSYAYDKYHVLTLKTWKQDAQTTNQNVFEVDANGNVLKETTMSDRGGRVVTDYAYDSFGNVTAKTVSSDGGSFVTYYEYGIDAGGTNVQGAYLTKQYKLLEDGRQSATVYGYDWNTGNRTAEIDPNGNRTAYEYDILNRPIKTVYADQSAKTYSFEESPYANMLVRYTDQVQNVFTYEYDITGTLVRASVWDNGAWNVLKTMEYDGKGNKTKEIDANGHSTRYEYDSKNRLVRKSRYENDTVDKGTLTLQYRLGASADTPLLVTVTDEEGYVKKMHYDILDRLRKVEATPDKARFVSMTYTYDYVGNKLTETNPRGYTTSYGYDGLGRLVKRTDALGYETSYGYNALNRVALHNEPGDRTTEFLFSALGLIAMRKTSRRGSQDYTYTAYEYDLAGNVLREKQGGVRAGVDEVSSDTSYAYDTRLRQTDEYRKVDDSRTAHVRYFYDGNGNRTGMVEYADAAETKYRMYAYSFDYAGQLKEESGVYRETDGPGGFRDYGSYRKTTQRDYAGNVTRQSVQNGGGWDTMEFAYDAGNRVISKKEPYGRQASKETRYRYDKVGNRTGETLTVGGIEADVTYMYDGLARMVKRIDPLGNTTRYVYDDSGNKIKEIDARYAALTEEAAPGTITEYDALNRPVKAIAFDGTSREVTMFRQYDGRGNVVKEADGEGYSDAQPERSIGIVMEYDADNRKVKIISAQTSARNGQSGGSQATRTIAYDGSGRVRSETDALGYTTTYTYYLNGKLKQATNAESAAERYDYDLTGKAMSVRIDRLGRETRTYHNIFDKPYRVENADGGVERFEYSAKGELIESYDAAGMAKRYEYDSSGNVTAKMEEIGAEGFYSNFKRTETAYDEANRPVASETFLVKVSGVSGAVEQTASAGDRVNMEYDKAGRLVRRAGPFGRETVQRFDQAGNVITKLAKVADGDYEVRRYAYDTRSRLVTESLLVKTSDLHSNSLAGAKFDNEYADRVVSATVLAYTKNGQLKSRTDPLGGVTRYEYDYDGHLLKKTDPMSAITEYRYDAKGRLTAEINPKGMSVLYEYDALDRLIRKNAPAADGSRAITRYVFDAVGNLLKEISPNEYNASLDTPAAVMSMPGMAYTYDAMNRRTATVAPDGAGIQYLGYDARGLVRKSVDGLRYTGNLDGSAGTVYEYDGLGRLIAQTDALGYRTSFVYDVLGNVTKKTDARGHATEYAYNADRTLAGVSYPDGGGTSYTYDKLGRKLSETGALGNTKAYRYNAFGQEKTATDPYGNTVESKYDLNGNLVSVKDKRGSVTLFKYDANKRMTEKRTPLDLDASGSVIYSIESYAYDSIGNIVKKSLTGTNDRAFVREQTYTYFDNNLLHTSADSSGAVTTNGYDKNGNLVRTEKLRDASEADVEKLVYDIRNRLVKRIRLVDQADLAGAADWPNLPFLRDAEAPGKIQVITGYEYDALGNRIKEYDPRAYAEQDTANREQYAVSYTYDALNRVDKVIRKYGGTDVYQQYAYDEVGNRISMRNERGFETKYTYDRMNRVLTMTDPEQHTFTYGYDLAGNKVTETNAKGHTMTYGYDQLNRLVTVTDPYNKVVTRNVLDVNGNAVKKIDAVGYQSANSDEERYGWTYTYDLANRLVRVLDPELAAKNKPELSTWTYRYNPAGEKIKETNALGHSTSYAYDGAGRLLQVTDPQGVSVAYSYDRAGNKTGMTDGRGKATSYTYGAFGLLRSATDPTRKPIVYRYNLALSVAEMTDRNGNHTVYAYDNRNLLTSRSVTETGDSIGYGYDEAGNRISMTDTSGTSSYAYDKNNRLLRITKDGVARITYTYDAVGNIETVTDSTGFTTSYTYDKSSRLETVTFQGKVTTYQYDDNGNRKAIVYGGGVTEQYEFDRNSRLIGLTNKKPDSSVLSSYRYTYDEAGQQTSKTDSFGTTDYAYDEAGRLLKVNAPGKTTLYGYDRAGNRQSQQETYTSAQPSGYVDPGTETELTYLVKKSEYVYTASNQLQKLIEKMADGTGQEVLEKTVLYLYDDNGNELRQQVSYIRPHKRSMRQVTGGNAVGDDADADLTPLIEKVSNVFDGFNRLKQTERIKAGERVTVDYVYDGDDLRTQKVVRSSKESYAAKTTNYLYDRQHVILESDASGSVAVRYVRGINYIARMDASAKLSYYLYNGHGDVVQTVSESGEVENQYDYDVFGNATLTVESEYSSAIRYAGEFFDAEVGLYYLRARYYNPYTGRFISEDSYWGEDANPLSLNRYTYAHNNPLMFVDPTGHSIFDAIKNFAKDTIDLVSEKTADFVDIVKSKWDYWSEEANEVASEVVSDTWNYVETKLDNWSEVAREAISDTRDYVETKLDNWSEVAREAISDTRDYVETKLDNWSEIASETVSDTRDYVETKLDNWGEVASEVVSDTWNYAVEYGTEADEYVDAFLEGASSALVRNMSFGLLPDHEPESEHTTTYALGELFGDVTSALLGTELAAGGTAGTVFFSPTGVGAVAAASAAYAGVGLIASSYGHISGDVEDLVQSFSSSSSGDAGTGESVPTKSGGGSDPADFVNPPAEKSKPSTSGDAEGTGNPVVDEYGILKKDTSIPGQAHHLNQDAAYRDVIPTNKGMSTKLEGNAFSEVGSPHYNAHESLEQFWNQYRRGGEKYGEVPTNLEYSKAMVDSLKAAGYPQEEAMQITAKAIEQRVEHGLLGGMPVPRIPSKINQSPRPLE
ncbi:RHS repeat-associated core domain-containing protein [Paenibacillus mesophilus]|uniref:RHS repeat-associated core domain-containing protein n=1 Tax=Paenibacillus mesophilus TaxID=2582849 RepID=UPI00130538DA|nr:RHS repeat-associated core domain-containing protein [Paenibacillus mesophilus]